MNTALVLAAAAVPAFVAAMLAKYAVTSHGENPWTAEAIMNMLRTARWINRARGMIGGTLSSAYRSPRVNAAVGGAATSRHMRGLASDLKPRAGMSADEAAGILWDAHERGELGPVQQIIAEAGWVHVGWLASGEAPRKAERLRAPDGKTFSSVATASRASVA